MIMNPILKAPLIWYTSFGLKVRRPTLTFIFKEVTIYECLREVKWTFESNRIHPVRRGESKSSWQMKSAFAHNLSFDFGCRLISLFSLQKGWITLLVISQWLSLSLLVFLKLCMRHGAFVTFLELKGLRGINGKWRENTVLEWMCRI